MSFFPNQTLRAGGRVDTIDKTGLLVRRRAIASALLLANEIVFCFLDAAVAAAAAFVNGNLLTWYCTT